MTSPQSSFAANNPQASNQPPQISKIFQRGEIVFADLGTSTNGSRLQDKLRPSLILKDNTSDPDYVLILQNNLGLRYSDTVILAPITSQIPSRPYPFHVNISNLTSRPAKLAPTGVIKLEQIFTLDKKWLKNSLGVLSIHDMKMVDKALIHSLGIKNTP